MNEIREQMSSVWEVEQEILTVIHEVCTKHGLRYSLAYGTLLGAVRHGGFIPWDDDVDLMMPREDYNILLQIWNEVAPEGYILSNSDTEEDCYLNFTKIVKDNTTFLQHEEDRNRNIHKGIFVDIFPADRLAPGKAGRVLQFCACAVNLLFSRGYTSKTGGIVECAERLLLRIPRKKHRKLRTKAQKFLSKWNGRAQTSYIFPCTIKECRKHYPADIFDTIESIKFNGKEYCCTAKWDAYLKLCYGNYMELPPEEDRVWKHHPIIIDFTHNYEELNN